MNAIHWTIAAAAFAIAQPAQAAQSDPEVIIYRFPGVFDSGGAANTGQATSFHCTNFSGAAETIRFVTRNAASTLLTNKSGPIGHLESRTVSTHPTDFYSNHFTLDTGAVLQGTTAIAATTTNIVCTAVTIDAANIPPTFAIPLRGIRFSPVPSSQE